MKLLLVPGESVQLPPLPNVTVEPRLRSGYDCMEWRRVILVHTWYTQKVRNLLNLQTKSGAERGT